MAKIIGLRPHLRGWYPSWEILDPVGLFHTHELPLTKTVTLTLNVNKVVCKNIHEYTTVQA